MPTLPSGMRRDTPSSHSKTVRLTSPASGEEHVGYFRVPRSAVALEEHSNKLLSYDRQVIAKVKEWIDWKRRQDFVMVSKPTVYVPTDSPTPGPGEESEDGDDMRVYVRATFRVTRDRFMPLDVFLDRKDSADRYGINFEDKILAENTLSDARPQAPADNDRNPMELAERRRAGLGLKRSLLVEDDEAVGGEVHK